MPADNSDMATAVAKKGERSKYSINASGGNGNLLRPWIIKAIDFLKIILN